MKIPPQSPASGGMQNNQTSQVGLSGQTEDALSSTRNFYALKAGAKFKATILDIKPSKVTIKLDGGGTFTARTLVLPDARIGEESIFLVKSNNLDGQILLEMLKIDPATLQSNAVKEALNHAGMYTGEENIALGRAIVEKNLSLEPQNLQKASFFLYGQQEQPQDNALEKAMFLLREGFQAETASLRGLETALDSTLHLRGTLNNLAEEILRLPPSNNQKALIQTLIGHKTNADMQDIRKSVYDRFFLQLSPNAPRKPLNTFYKELQEAVLQLQELAKSFRSLQAGLIAVRDSLSFMSQLTKDIQYYQIPFIANQQPQQGELFVYKDKAHGGRSLDKEAHVLIALDTASLGRVEVLTHKTEKQLQFKFSGTDETLKLLQKHSSKLAGLLQEKGFQISGLTYQQLQKNQGKDERTTVLSPSPIEENSMPPTPPKRYAFDMRV